MAIEFVNPLSLTIRIRIRERKLCYFSRGAYQIQCDYDISRAGGAKKILTYKFEVPITTILLIHFCITLVFQAFQGSFEHFPGLEKAFCFSRLFQGF